MPSEEELQARIAELEAQLQAQQGTPQVSPDFLQTTQVTPVQEISPVDYEPGEFADTAPVDVYGDGSQYRYTRNQQGDRVLRNMLPGDAAHHADELPS